MTDVDAPSRRRWAVVLSAVVHLSVVFIAGVPGGGAGARAGSNAPAEPPPREDEPTVVGDTFDIDLVGPKGEGWNLALPSPAAATPAPTAAAAPPPPAPTAAVAQPPLPLPKKKKPRRRKKRRRRRRPTVASASAAPLASTSAVPRASGSPLGSSVPKPGGPIAQPHTKPGADGKPGNPTGEGKTYGQNAKPRRGFRYLSAAFVRALPAAVSADKKWKSLPLGEITQGNIQFDIDANGKIAGTTVEPANPLIQRMLRRTLPLLNAGEFMLHTDPKAAGTEVYRLTVRIEQRDPPKAGGKDAEIQLGQVRPTSRTPGKAFFTLRNGRYVEIEVAISASRSHR